MSLPITMIARELAQRFGKLFGDHPRIFRAPGRVNLIGEHTDYNDGFVMPAAVGFSTYLAIAARPDRKLVIHSEEFPGNFEFDLDHLPERRTGGWCDYVLGVASVLLRRGFKLQAANLLVHGEVPIGAGLSSSAAVEVASALAFMSMSATTGETRLPLPEIAKLCREAENSFVGARVGIMDQFVCSFPFRQVRLSWSATQWSNTIWPLAHTIHGGKNARRACAVSPSGIREFAPCAMCPRKCSISTPGIFRPRSRNDVLTSSAKTSAPSMPRARSPKATSLECGN